jgi:hypothetical protein
MSREAWGDPPETERESCPYCGGTHYMTGCDHCDAVKAKCAATFEAVQLRAALLNCARQAEALKRDCGMDPESKQAVRNAQYQNISTTAHIALGTIRGARPVLGEKELSATAQALAAKKEEEQRELRAAQEADELRASLKEVVNHWREFGPDHGFDECIERAAGRRGLGA